MYTHKLDNDFKSTHDDMRPSSPSEQLHVMSERSSGRSSLESPGPGGMNNVYSHWQSRDPRNSSSQSLAPTVGDDNGRRTLLVLYLHGFMGNDSSFRSFPAHVHSYLKEALEETHVVHTKIYPRYKTYKSIDVARDNFSKWLEPHESNTTDIVLVGHSMGGLLAADVVLMVRTVSMISRDDCRTDLLVAWKPWKQVQTSYSRHHFPRFAVSGTAPWNHCLGYCELIPASR